MSREHVDAYNRFADFLRARRAEPPDARDIRAHMLSLRDRRIGLGYVPAALAGGYGANLTRLFPRAIPLGEPGWASCGTLLMLGTIYREAGRSHAGGTRLFRQWDGRQELILFEQGFLASTHSWSHAFRERDPRFACLGYVYDDIAHYFMADYPNRLTHKLNGPETPSPAELARARRLIERIVARRISKYNAQPIVSPVPPDGVRRVLVCDQAHADASTVYGRIGAAGFEAMLLAAIRENPDAEILVKTHPDTAWNTGKRGGYFSHLSSHGRVRLLRDPVNPFALFDLVDRVYVGTSQLGLEALFAGKPVTCFGAPFYAGWGLTDDRIEVPHRHRRRTLEEIFHYTYLWYTIYHVPGAELPSPIEAVLDYIEDTRPVSLPPDDSAHDRPPVVSMVMPVHNVAPVLEAAIGSVQRQRLAEIEIIPVVDAATDESRAIVERLAAQDRRIRPIILTENVGQGMARNSGIDAARGSFLFFLDADDLMADPDVLSDAVAAARDSGAEMVRVQKLAFTDGDDPHLARLDPVERHFAEKCVQRDLSGDIRVLESWHVWQFLYSAELVKRCNLRFLTPRWEERPFVVHALHDARGIYHLPRPGVRYRKRAQSTTGQARSADDLRMFLSAIRAVAALYGDTPEGRVLAAQFAGVVLRNAAWKTCLSAALAGAGGDALFAEIKGLFAQFGMETADWQDIVGRFVTIGEAVPAIDLLFAALANDRRDMVNLTLRRNPVPIELLHRNFRRAPHSPQARWLKDALNGYAHNRLVTFPARRQRRTGPGPRVVIHIGASKTGSTFLQTLFDRNRPALLRQGIWYPEKGLLRHGGRPQKQGGHALLLSAAKSGDRRMRRFLADVPQQSDGIHTILLSSEAFFLDPRGPELLDMFPGAQCNVVVYLRRQDDWANSQYHELVAGGAVGRVTADIGTWLRDPETRRLLDYRNVLGAWAARVGRDNVIVRPYDESRWPGHDLAADFAAQTELPQIAALPRPERTNPPRLSSAHGEMLRHINARAFATRAAYLSFIEDVTDTLSHWRSKRGLPVPPPDYLAQAERETLMAGLSQANAEIARDWMHEDGAALLSRPRQGAEQQDSLHPEERDLIETVYAQYSVDAAEETSAEIVNYGAFGWRLWLLAPLVRPFVIRHGTEEDVTRYDEDPAGFFRALETPAYRAWAQRLFPQASPYGPFAVFRVWIGPVAFVLRHLSGEDIARRVESDPILFFRTRRTGSIRLLGRFLFPMGELQGRRSPRG